MSMHKEKEAVVESEIVAEFVKVLHTETIPLGQRIEGARRYLRLQERLHSSTVDKLMSYEAKYFAGEFRRAKARLSWQATTRQALLFEDILILRQFCRYEAALIDRLYEVFHAYVEEVRSTILSSLPSVRLFGL